MPGTPTFHRKYFQQWIQKIYFLQLLFDRAHILRTLIDIEAGEGSCLETVSFTSAEVIYCIMKIVNCIHLNSNRYDFEKDTFDSATHLHPALIGL